MLRRRRRAAAGGRGGRAAAEAAAAEAPVVGRQPLAMSPDGKRARFIRDWNLWVRDVATGRRSALTTDGVKDFGYATDNAGWARSDRAIVLGRPTRRRSRRSSRTSARSARCISSTTNVGHPKLARGSIPLPGDSVVAMLHRVIIDVDGGRIVRLQLPPDYHRATLGDNISDGRLQLEPGRRRSSRSCRRRAITRRRGFRVADAATGAVRTVFEETSPTQFESRTGWRVLWATNEVIW